MWILQARPGKRSPEAAVRIAHDMALDPDFPLSRDEALARTAEIRPDLIAALDCKALDKADRKTLMALGWEVSAAHPRRLAD